MALEKEIWMLAECERGELSESSLEVACEATAVAKSLGCTARAFLLGNGLDEAAAKLVAYGIGTVCVCDRPELETFDAARFADIVYAAADGKKPRVFLVAATSNGMALAARLAAKMKYAYLDGMVSVAESEDGSLMVTQSVLGDKVHSKVKVAAHSGVVVTARPGSIGVGPAPKKSAGEVQSIELDALPEASTEVTGFVKADPRVVALDEADLVAAGGLGFASAEEFQMMQALADALGAAVAGSKPVFDNQWIPRKRFVGQSSGRKLAPRLFVAVGVSGSNYFMGGMKGSQTIVAVNKDKGAPMMQAADLAVVGDLHEIVPVLTEVLQKRKEERR